ncbi:hypothetical protein PVL29_021392 [Vitis rotundifolia]|uniref:Leucine-rich repeat-containing N-terminal plant-type domain-containing protein n=1 Tax=Vitis rotundifolia TaxID=103349 RepID=A0AA38YZ85_VITRO|nr:hypothetical protein PVL29_021392 [Vitis rotundifolia]
MTISKAIIVFLLLCFLSSTITILCDPNPLVCNETEKHALLSFKHALFDPTHSLSSWSAQEDCCGWNGVRCHNITGRVVDLDLFNFGLVGKISLALLQLEFLNYLDLSWNDFGGTPIPSFLGFMWSLTYLDLSFASFGGLIPHQLGNLSNLFHLRLGGGHSPYEPQLYAENLRWISYLSSLKLLFMFKVDLHQEGQWVESTSMLSSLSTLLLADCELDNMSPSLEYVNFTSLAALSLLGNHFNHEIPYWLSNLTASLLELNLNGNSLKGHIPEYLGQLKHLEALSLGYNSFDGPIPSSLGNLSSLKYLSLDGNRLNGTLPSSLFPALSPNAIVLNMANNSFSGPTSHFLCQKLNGRSKLEALDLSNNDLSGELPLCWKSWQSLTHVNLGNNNFSGKIPDSIGSLFSLKALHLQNNGLSGSIPSSLRDCTSLGLLDLSGNKLLGNIPNWIGELTALKALCLRSNKFIGEIPSQICQLSSLIVLDVSDNELSGIIPRCLNNFSLMATIDTPDYLFTDLEYSTFELEGLVLVTVGRELEYKGILKYVRMVDLSSNNLSGSIPIELSQLFGLRFLNVSKNHLMGRIPEKIGRMTSLLSLDLSTNHLSGEIPQSLADLTFLNRLNLSYNQFRGRIPLSTQLQSFDAFSYIGNAQLCGAPLTKNCTEDDESQGMDTSHTTDENEEGSEMRWFYISMGLGFIVGFWGVCGALLFKENWRNAYFQFLYDIRDWMYVAVAIRLNRFHDNLRRLLGKQED